MAKDVDARICEELQRRRGHIERLTNLIMTLAEIDGATPLNRNSDLWVRQVGKIWTVVANPHRSLRRYQGVAVRPFHFYVQFKGIPPACGMS